MVFIQLLLELELQPPSGREALHQDLLVILPELDRRNHPATRLESLRRTQGRTIAGRRDAQTLPHKHDIVIGFGSEAAAPPRAPGGPGWRRPATLPRAPQGDPVAGRDPPGGP